MDYFTPKRYLEYKVTEWDHKEKAPKRKELTAKGYAMITDKEAHVLNTMAESRRTWYELDAKAEAKTAKTKPE
jgi:hypothetical protein